VSEAGLQQAKSQRARDAICAATIESLVSVGYAETSLNRVASSAGFSKGALQHHFPNKEDLIAATVDELLARTFKPLPEKSRPVSVEQALMNAWNRFINTPAYRALMEILGAARTDTNLQKRLSTELVSWGQRMDQQTLENYEAVSGDEAESIMLLNMTRSFMRGLLFQERYGVSQEQTTEYVKKWVELVSPLLKLKG
jgi:AcrR family transcriptional regulator